MEIDPTIIEKERVNTTASQKPGASVVVVTYNTNEKLLIENLNSLVNQSAENFEIIVVDNSDKKDLESIVCDFPVTYIKLKENAGLSVGRNVGTSRARGDIVIFLDDDAVPARDFVQEHIKAYQTHDIAGLRGKALPRTNTIYNYLASTYDLGDKVIPHYINLEGNSSVKKDILVQMGGFYWQIKGAGGYEGAELSYRIVNHFKDRNKLIYYPGPVIYHDNCGSFLKYYQKRKRHLKYKEQLTEKYPDLFAFMDSYPLPQEIKPASEHPFFIKLKLWLIRKNLSLLLKLNQKLLRGSSEASRGGFLEKSLPGGRRQ
ncbi:MAG: glycosyltransferase [Candidatus Aminicenantes bacterium]